MMMMPTPRFTFCPERTPNPMSRLSIWQPLQRFLNDDDCDGEYDYPDGHDDEDNDVFMRNLVWA